MIMKSNSALRLRLRFQSQQMHRIAVAPRHRSKGEAAMAKCIKARSIPISDRRKEQQGPAHCGIYKACMDGLPGFQP